MGAIMVFNTTSAEVIDKRVEIASYLSMFKQITFCLFGVFVGYLIYLCGYKKLVEKSHILMAFLVFLLILVFVPKIGMQINGARRWINCFGISLQPSEFVKIALPLLFLRFVAHKKPITSFYKFFLIQSVLLIPVALIIVEPDNGTAAILLASMVILCFITKIPWKFWVIPILIVAVLGVTLGLSMSHVRSRIYIYLHPEADLLGKGHQPYQAKIAAGSGGLIGKGLGESLQKYNYLPEARSDYIAAIYAEEFGFLGILTLVLLYMVIAALGFMRAFNAKEELGYYVATIFTFMISLQAFLNLGVVSGLLPSKGTNLPFFSQGGSSLLANIFMLALIMNVEKLEVECEKKLLLQ
jgi:cell division protein FtsW